jgi:membrane-associated phospholipid phosphatase
MKKPHLRQRLSLQPHFLVTVLFYIILTPCAYSQANSVKAVYPPKENRTSVLMNDLNHFLKSGSRIAQAPVNFTRSNWRDAGIALGTTLLLFTADKTVRKTALSNRNDFNDHLFYVDHFYGGIYEAGFTVVLYGAGYVSHHQNIRLMGLHSAEAFLYAGALTAIIKFVAGRRRPSAGESNLIFKPFNFDNTYNSIPSGHATVAFAASTVMAKSVDNTCWDIFWYGLAGLTGASRIYHNQHWISDVFLGSVLGYGVASFIMTQDGTPSENKLTFGRLTVTPYFLSTIAGVQITF